MKVWPLSGLGVKLIVAWLVTPMVKDSKAKKIPGVLLINLKAIKPRMTVG